MKTTIKLGIALVMGSVLFFTPIRCAGGMSLAATPAHPCCPKPPAPLPSDCAKPGCFPMEVKAMVAEAPAVTGHELAGTTELGNIAVHRHEVRWGSAPERVLLTRNDRYLTLHQLLL